MAQINGVFRIGRDVELRYTANGDAVANVALAFNYGRKGDDGKRPSQWIEASIWNKRAEALAPYLLKGGQVYAVIDDPHIETYEGKNGFGAKIVGTISAVELVGSKDGASQGQEQQRQPQQRQAQAPAQAPRQAAPQRQPQQKTNTGFDDMDDDIPF
jgi:single-strand DNA-binding protein